MNAPRLAAVAVVSFAAAPVVAQVGPDLLLKPFPVDERDFEHTSGATILETGDSGNGFSLGIDVFENEGRVRVPAPEGSILDQAQARVGYRYTHLYLDTGDPVLPKNLVDVAVGYGMGVFQSQDETVVAGVSLGVGYAAAGAFGDANGYYALADLAVGKEFQQDGRFFKSGDRFGFVLNYDGNRTLFPDIPLPGFQFIRKPREDLELSVGFPFSSVVYEPSEQLTLRLTYSVPDSLTGRVDYGFNDGLGVFAEYAIQTEAFHSDTLADADDRILFRQQRAEAGVRYKMQDRLNVIAAAGFAFGQEFNVGFDTRSDEEIADPSDEPYVRLAIEYNF